LARKKSQKNKGNNPNIGRGTTREKFQKIREEASSSRNQIVRGGGSRGGESRGRRHFLRGRGRGIGGEVKCYACGKIRHMSWECPKTKLQVSKKLMLSRLNRRL
jgi:hypothetical protein